MCNNGKLDKNTKFLVTGAAGFIGSNLVESLLDAGYKVRGLDNFSTGKRENINIFEGNSLFEFIEGDIRDFSTCKKACHGIDYVFHEAAFGSVPKSFKFPLLYEDINIGGTLKMMQAALEENVKKFVYASSSSIYGDSKVLPQIEGAEGKVLSPYALTKKVDEQYAKLYNDYYNLKTIGLRYFNVFGKRQDADSEYSAVIPIFIKKILSNEQVIINGDGNQKRDFTYIENVIEANLKACISDVSSCGEVYNIACGESTDLNTLYYELCKLLNKSLKPIYGLKRVGDINNSYADIKKANRDLKYIPKYNVFEGLKVTVEWYKKIYLNSFI